MAAAKCIEKPNSLVCLLCFGPFNSPRVLPCLHTFCDKCLDSQIKSQIQSGSKFVCPICEVVAFPDNNELPVEKWARAFPLNDIVVLLMNTLEGVRINDDNCQPCTADGETTTAEFWCSDCCERLCGSCKHSHKLMKMLRHHRVVTIDERKRDQQQNIQLSSIQECICHRGHKYELFCSNHRELGCVLCIASRHRECSNILKITDVASQQTRLSAYKKMAKDLMKIETELNKLPTDKTDKFKQMEREKEQILHDMDAMVDEVIARINEHRQNFKRKTEENFTDTKSSLLKNDKAVRSFKTNITNCKQILDSLENICSSAQKFVLYENLRSQLVSHYEQLKNQLQNYKEDVHFILKPNSLLKKLDKVGTLEITTKTSAAINDAAKEIDNAVNYFNLRTIETGLCAAQVEKVDLMTSPVTFVTSLTKKELGLGTWFTGGTYLHNGHLLMAYHYNKLLIEFDDKYSIVKEHKMDGRPTDVATGSPDKVVYVAVNGDSIYKCTLDSDLTVINRLKAPEDTWGIAISDDNIIIGANNQVVIMTQDGTNVKSFSTTTTTLRPYNYLNSYVAVSGTQRTLYYAKERDSVVCCAMEGGERFKYAHQQLDTSWGICLDRFNTLYISCHEFGTVHQVSPDGRRNRILLNKLRNISRPCYMIFNDKKNELVITSCGENTVIEVYRLS